MPRPPLGVFASFLVASAALASQALPDLRLAPGQPAQGEIAFDGEEDRVAVDLLAGQKLSFTAKSSRKSALRPASDLYDAAGVPAVVDAALRVAKPTSSTIKNWVVPATGTYLLGIRGTTAGPTGLYDLTTKAKAAPALKPVAGSIDAGGEIDEVPFDAPVGAVLTLTLKSGKGSDLVPRIESVVGPDSAPVSLDGAKRKSKDTSESLKGVALPLFGRHVVRVQGSGISTGAYTLSLAVKAPKLVKTRLDFRGASGGESGAGAVTAIEVVPGVVTLVPGAKRQFLARATYADGRVRDGTRAVTWGTRDRGVATVTNGTSCGIATAVAAGGTTIQAWAGAVEGREALALVGATVTSVVVVPSATTLAPGDTATLSARASFSAGLDADVTNAALLESAGGVAVTLAGSRATAGGTSGASQATASVGGVTSAPHDLTITSRRVERIVVLPAYVEAASGARSFTATATFSDGTTGDVTATAAWASDNAAAATTSGATATVVAAGTAGIRATLDGVTSRPAVLNCGPVALQSVAVSGSATAPHGATRDFIALGAFADGGTRDVTEAAAWTTGAPGVVTISTTAGTRGRATGVAATGAATITATVVTGAGSRAGQAATTAAPAERTSLVVVPRITSVAVSGTVPYRAFARLSDGSFEDVSALATWTSSNPAVATVAAGDVTGVANGGASLAASIDSLTAHAVVLAGTGRLTGLAVVPPATIALGDSGEATAFASFAPSAGGDPAASVGLAASWSSADPLALPVGATGVVAARRIGASDVVAVVAATTAVPQSVAPGAAAERSLVIFPQSARAIAGADVQLAAQVASSDGSFADRAAASVWNHLDPAKATVNATGRVHAVSKGGAGVTAARPISGLSDTATFNVLSDPPTISTVVASPLQRGTSGNVVTINGQNLDGPGLSVTFSGTGVTADAAPTVNPGGTQATVPVSVTAGATTGARNLTYTTLSGSATKTGAVTVFGATPAIASVSPPNIDVPGAGSVAPTLTVTGTGFASGDTFTLTTHAGVVLSNVVVVNSTTLTGTVTVQSTAQKARLDVTVVQSAAAGGQTATLTGALKIGPADPTVTSLVPAYFLPGDQNAAGTITGTNFAAGISVVFTGSGGNFTHSSSRQSATSVSLQLTAASNAQPALYDLVLQNPNDLARTFTGLLVLAPRDPAVASFSAASLSRGLSGASVEVRGSNFRSGDTLSASGTGVTLSNVSVTSAERITASVAVDAGATISVRDLLVSHASSVGGRSGRLAAAFRVTGAVPTVTSCSPSNVGRTGTGGAKRRVPVTVTGTNFCSGATAAVARSGGVGVAVAANTEVVVSDTKLVFDLDVNGNATVGTWNVTVTNPGTLGNSGTSGNAALQVVSETTLAVNRVIAPTGSAQGGERVTVYGSGFVRGCEVDFGTQKAPGAQFIDQNTLVCTVPPPANPSSASASSISRTATTFVNVTVTNYPGLQNTASAVLTNGYGYLANAQVFRIQQSYPADGATGVPWNLRSAVVRLSDYANTATPIAGTSVASPTFPTRTDCAWFESGASFVANQTVGFGADRRFLVFSRTGGGNLVYTGTLTTPGQYVLHTSTSVKSAAGAALVPAKLAQSLTYDQWLFRITNTTVDNAAPTLSSSTPASNATAVSTNTAVSLVFSEDIDPLTITATSITLTLNSTPVACAVSLANDIRTVTLTPYAELGTSTTYTITVTSAVADLCGNAFSQSTRTFTTGSGTDGTAPTVDSVVFEQIPADMDGAGTYAAGTDTPNFVANAAQAFDLYLPRHSWRVTAAYSDTGGSGVDEATFSAKASVASGATGANTELALKFDVTSTSATWTVASADALTAGDDVTLTFLVTDKSGNTSSAKVVTFDVVDITATAAGSGGGNLAPLDSRETWVLRFDRDVYTALLSTNGTNQQCATTAAANGITDFEEAMRISGLSTANMTTPAASTVNGSSVGTNAIVARLIQERIRATLRARFGIGEDGSRGADAADIEFLLPGEQGSLTGLPVWSTTSSGSSSHAYSEMDIGGDTGPNTSPTGTYSAIGYSYIDQRNRSREADMNDGLAAGSNNGIFGINISKSVMNLSTTGTTWGSRVLKNFQTAKSGTPIGEGSLDDDVLAGTFDRTAAGNTQAMNDRYDAIMTAIEDSALSVSSIVAHEIGHALGLVPDGGPKTGLFGNAPRSNTFTEATASLPNTPWHLNAIGNDVMSPASSVD